MQTAYRDAMRIGGTRIMSIKTSVRVLYTEYSTGTIIDKSILPVDIAPKANFPVYLFLNYDRHGRSIGNKVYPFPIFDLQSPVNGDWGVLDSFTWPEFNTTPLPLGFIVDSSNFKFGDLIIRYYANSPLAGASYVAWVFISSDSIGYTSLLAESDYKPITTRQVLYLSDNINQFMHPLNIVKCNSIGQFTINQFFPLANKTIDTIQNDFIDMKLAIKLDRYTGIYTLLLFATNTMIFEYKFLY